MILRCISTVSFKVLVKEQPSQAFISSGRIGQGNPLSPFLFIIVSKRLSTLIWRVI